MERLSATADEAPRLRPWVIYGLGAALLLLNAWFGTYAYVVVQALIWTQTSLQRGPVVLLFVLTLLNLPLLRLARRAGIRRAELAALFSMLCAGTCAAGYGFVQILINHMAAPFYANYATSASRFKEYLWPQIPAWLAPRDPAVIDGFFRGNRTLYDPVVLAGWAMPVLAWSAFLVAVFWTLLCAMALLRRQWVEAERLTFPLVLIPLELCADPGAPTPFWRSRGLWAGFVLAGLLESVNFVNFLYPSWPQIPLKPGMGSNEIGLLLTDRPWNAVGRLALAFYPCVLGIGYLLALDVSFSCWALYLLGKGAQVACSWLGLTDSGGSGPANRAPFLREQGIGAFVGVALFSVWMARKTIAAAWRARDTGDELLAPRIATFGAALGLAAQVGFLSLAGLDLARAAVYVGVYSACAITLARIVSEAGAGWAMGPSWSPTMFTADLFGVNHLTGRQAGVLLGYTPWMADMRDNPMPHTAEALKLAQGVRLPPRALLGPLLFAIGWGVLAAFWAHLDIYYTYGAATAKVRPALQGGSTGPARQTVSLLVTPTLQDVSGLLAAGAGGAIAVGLSVLRQRLSGWAIHPLGYALATTGSMEYMWCPFFLAWLGKALTLRYGGIRAYRAAVPFCLGLVLGDYVVPTLWGLFGMATGYQQYMVFPH